MASGTFYPAVGADDGFGRLPSGEYNNSGNLLSMGNAGAVAGYAIWMRFPSVNIPQGSTINEAYVKFTCVADGSIETCNLNLYFEDSDNAVAPTDIGEFNGLSLTGAVAWNALPAWINGIQYDTPGLASILQNVVDRGGFSSGNAVQLVVKDNSSSSSAHRQASSVDLFAGAEKAELHVTWTEGAQTSISDLYSDIRASEEIISDFLSSISAGSESIHDLNSALNAAKESLKYLKGDIAADFLTKFSDLFTEISAEVQKVLDLLTDTQAGNQAVLDLQTNIVTQAQIISDLASEINALTHNFRNLTTSIQALRSKWWLNTEIKAGNQVLLDLHTDTRTRAQIVTDLKSEINALVESFHNLNISVEALRSKWWFNTEIKAGCAARWNFNTEWNPNRLLYTQIAAKKPYEFSFKTQSAEGFAATEPSVEFKIPGYSFPIRTLFLDYIAVGGINEYQLELWWARGLIGKDGLKNVKIKAEYIDTQYSGGYEVVTCNWLSCAINDGEYNTINETPLFLGDIQCDSHLKFNLKVECRDCSLTRGIVFFKLSISGDYKESIYGDKIVYQDGSRYHAGEQDDYQSIDFISRLYVVE